LVLKGLKSRHRKIGSVYLKVEENRQTKLCALQLAIFGRWCELKFKKRLRNIASSNRRNFWENIEPALEKKRVHKHLGDGGWLVTF